MDGDMSGLKARMRRPSPEQEVREITSRLRRLGDPKRARATQRYFKHEVAALGIATPVALAFASERARELRQVWKISQAIQLCDRLFHEPELEIRGTGILILGAFRDELKPAILKPAERWLRRHLDNWALVDAFSRTVLSPLLERHPEVEKTLNAWSHAELLWLRRAALVTLVRFARRGHHLNTAYRLAREHFADSEDLMHKATGWLLREAGKTDMPRLKRFLLQHGPAIPRTALRYAIERFPATERAKLLKATRQPSNKRKIA
jgi:3-methyladenine DNA glycosylase AlkD